MLHNYGYYWETKSLEGGFKSSDTEALPAFLKFCPFWERRELLRGLEEVVASW